MRTINKIIIHHSASNFGDAKTINEWHKQNGWSGIGYHYVIMNGYRTGENFKKGNIDTNLIGKIEEGRNINEAGSHAKGHNANSVGVCLIHCDQPYDEKQLESYRNLVVSLAQIYNVEIKNIIGHYEVEKGKPLCPSLDMEEERERIRELLNE